MKRILFVCTGNTCRSPMAEYLWNSKRDPAYKKAIAESAGLTAFEGMPISDGAYTALKEKGIDATYHRARRFTAEMANNYDLIVAISPAHANMIHTICSDAAEGKVAVLGNGISDPYGLGIDTYIECRDEIEEGLKDVIQYLD